MSTLRPLLIFAVLLASRCSYAAEAILIADFEGDAYGDWQVTG